MGGNGTGGQKRSSEKGAHKAEEASEDGDGREAEREANWDIMNKNQKKKWKRRYWCDEE